jgi:glutamate synthase domain-containing protein 2
MSEEPGVSPLTIDKVTHYLHAGYHARSWGEVEVPPALGDARWTSDLILATWYMGETGRVPEGRFEYRVGASGGGFDRLAFKTLPAAERRAADAPVDLTLPLNRRGSGRELTLELPFYGGGMSYGSVSEHILLARAMAAHRAGTLTSTGEGGYPPSLARYRDRVITQVATGLFGVEERTIQYAPMVEFKYAQGAKPGLGGHLLGSKTTTAVSKMRGSVPWVSLFSPFPFHSVYSVEDHKKHVDWILTVNPEALVSVKVSTPVDVDMVAIGSYYAGAHVVHLDGSFGGTGAAPEIAKKNIAMPIELAVPKVHKHLIKEGIREHLTLIASGGIRTAHDVAKIIALGADGAVIATSELVAMGCTRCSNCERGRGCPFGLTTTDPELKEWIEPEWGAERLGNLYRAFSRQLAELLRELGLTTIRQLRGRTDLLRYLPEAAS